MNQGGDIGITEIDSHSTSEETRKSTRNKKAVDRYGDWKTYLLIKQNLEETNSEETKLEAMAFQTFVKENAIVPDSFKTAQQSSEWPLWRKAIFTELDSIIENGVFEVIPKEKRDKAKTLINTQWVLNK